MQSRSLSRIVRTMMISAALTLLVTLSASAQMSTESRPYSGSTVNPCNGEMIAFSGTIHINEKTQISPDGRIHFVAHDNFSASGRGQSTGITYNINGTLQTNSKFPSFPITFRQRSRFISTGAAPSFHATFAFHVNGAGLQTQVSTTSDCKG
jgi:hypothetical protein